VKAERFKIARAAVANMRPLLYGILAFVVLWAGVSALVVGLLSKGAFVFPAGILAAVAALLVYANMPGWVTIGDDALYVDLRGKDKRLITLSSIERVTVYRESALGKHEWLARLRAFGHEDAGGFRDPKIPPERLWRIVEDPSAPASARAGAAVALRAKLDDDGRTRIRVAADATAAPKLRVALESTAAEDDQAVRDALDELRDER
jgi:hypothetical protein